MISMGMVASLGDVLEVRAPSIMPSLMPRMVAGFEVSYKFPVILKVAGNWNAPIAFNLSFLAPTYHRERW